MTFSLESKASSPFQKASARAAALPAAVVTLILLTVCIESVVHEPVQAPCYNQSRLPAFQMDIVMTMLPAKSSLIAGSLLLSQQIGEVDDDISSVRSS